MAPMQLGNFSVSLAVKDIQASKQFYEKLGFTSAMDGSQGWLILKNGDVVIGLAGIDLIYLRLSALLCAADRVLPPRDR